MSGIELRGFVNVHSHAFQRALRGRVQRKDPKKRDTFWTWRTAMYRLANSLDVSSVEEIARLCYMECLEAGYTAVGEFHYLHHDPSGVPYENRLATSQAIVRAARETGIRLNLLWTVYQTGGFSDELEPSQRRFAAGTLDDIWRTIDSLIHLEESEKIHIGLALHSVRAVPEEWLGPLAEGARARGLKIHAHVSEQELENEACLAATGLTPTAYLSKHGVLGPDFTAIHATWIDDDDLALLTSSQSLVGVCPTTEGDLGDGFPRTADLYEHGVRLCIGSDSHAVIDPFCELRMLEYQARAREKSRCILSDDQGLVAPVLSRIGSVNGLASLGFENATDSVTLDSSALLLQGSADPFETALMSGHPGIVSRVTLDGVEVVREGVHILRK